MHASRFTKLGRIHVVACITMSLLAAFASVGQSNFSDLYDYYFPSNFEALFYLQYRLKFDKDLFVPGRG